MLPNMRIVILLPLISWLPMPSPALGAGAGFDSPYLTTLEAQVLREMNLARARPAGYAASLEQLRKYFKGTQFKRPREAAVQTQEGVNAVDDAVTYLKMIEPVEALRPSPGMSRAARDHVLDQGPKGGLGHQGSDGSGMSERVRRYGEWRGKIAENISYGHEDAREIVMQLIIDDGNPDRGHRESLFDPAHRVVGVACGKHAKYRAMCVTTFAAGYEEAPD